MAVSAGALLSERLHEVRRVVLITRQPDALQSNIAEVVLQGLGIDMETPMEERLGGAPATLEALLAAPSGTLVIAVDPLAPAGAGAAIIGEGHITLEEKGAARFSMPIRTRFVGESEDRVYDDSRLLRERGWKRVASQLANDGFSVVAGLSEKEAKDITRNGIGEGSANQAAATLFGLARIVDDFNEATLIAIEAGFGVAVGVTVTGGTHVIRESRSPTSAPPTWDPIAPGSIPISIAAYERAFEAKVGFKVSVCDCGEFSYPPKIRCSNCGVTGATKLIPMPKEGLIYSVVKVHTPVPGKFVPYSLALVDIRDLPVRALVHVTDNANAAQIGGEGDLVLRRVAFRTGVSDYGFALRLKEEA